MGFKLDDWMTGIPEPRALMKTLIVVLVLIVVIGVILGWLTISSSNDTGKPNVTFSVDKDKIEADKNKAVDKVQEMGHKTATTTQKTQD